MSTTLNLQQVDEQDAAILASRVEARNARSSDIPQVGDWISFDSGRMERVTHVWPADWNDDGIARCQTTHPRFGGGSFYLGDSDTSYSGALDDGIPADILFPTDETKPGHVWFFHHNQHRAHNGVDVEIDCAVWTCPRD